ncbi:MAG: helix-turn-helix transcriptional regulator [Bacillota bacterium]
MTVGERVRFLRETLRADDKKKYSLDSVAQRLGSVTKQSLSLIERGKIQNPSSIIINKLAAEFGVTVDYLLTGIGGYKEEFLNKRVILENELELCRDTQNSHIPNSTALPLLYEKISNLLDLFDIVCSCLKREVLGNYDKYSLEMDKLIGFLRLLSSTMQSADRVEGQFVKFLDEAFWKLGKTIRQVAVLIDQDGNLRNFQSWEIKKIADIATMVAKSAFQESNGSIEQQTLEIVLPNFQLNMSYSGKKIIPDAYLSEFKNRVTFEWQTMLNRLDSISLTANQPGSGE